MPGYLPVTRKARKAQAAALLPFLAVGCAMADIGDGEEPGLEEIEFAADNGIFLDNGLNLPNGMNLGNGTALHNGMNLGNGVDLANGMNLGNGLDLGNGITGPFYAPPAGSGLEQWIDVDPPARKKVLRYLVECALPAGTAVQLEYRGGLELLGHGVAGLGPSLQRGVMVVADQERVTACMLARVNGTGRTIQIDMFGPMGAGSGFQTSTASDDAFPLVEAAFFCNLFSSRVAAYACHAAERDLADMRSCRDAGDGTADCGVIQFIAVNCGDYLGDPPLCDSAETSGDEPRLYYRDCRSSGEVWEYVLTTYLAKRGSGEICEYDEDCASERCGDDWRCR